LRHSAHVNRIFHILYHQNGVSCQRLYNLCQEGNSTNGIRNNENKYINDNKTKCNKNKPNWKNKKDNTIDVSNWTKYKRTETCAENLQYITKHMASITVFVIISLTKTQNGI